MSSASSLKKNDQHAKPNTDISEAEQTAFDRAVRELMPTSGDLTVALETVNSISEADLKTCFDLIEETSSAAYKVSSRGWCPKQKWREMQEEGMRYILLLAGESSTEEVSKRSKAEAHNKRIAGFLSYMITEEDGYDVSYVYEIHLSAEVRGKGAGSSLMKIVDVIARAVGMEMVMLTVFTSNEGAIKLYKRLGYEKWDEEPIISKRKKLRSGWKEIKPSYVILAKQLKKLENDTA